MNVLETHSCPECKSALVDDAQNGEIVCSGCGVVVEEQMAYYGPETVSSNPEERQRQARATGQTTYSQHDLGIATEISQSPKDFGGKRISSDVANQMHRLRKWQPRVRVSTSKDRRLVSILSKIGEACSSQGLPKNVQETAAMIYRSLDGHIDVKGKSVVSMTTATIYMACKRCDVVRSLEEICSGVCQPKDVKSKTKLAARYYRAMVMEMGQVAAPPMTMDRYISKIANMTQTEARVERLALEIADKTKGSNIADGKAPNGIAAAYLYVASVLLGQSVLQRDVSSISGVTEVTIRNRCKEILTCYKLRITLRPALTK